MLANGGAPPGTAASVTGGGVAFPDASEFPTNRGLVVSDSDALPTGKGVAPLEGELGAPAPGAGSTPGVEVESAADSDAAESDAADPAAGALSADLTPSRTFADFLPFSALTWSVFRTVVSGSAAAALASSAS